jgi:hypothetical protein
VWRIAGGGGAVVPAKVACMPSTKAVAKIVDDLDVLTAFYDFPAEH